MGVYVVPGYQLPGSIYKYMTEVEALTGFDYQYEMWLSNDSFSDQIRREIVEKKYYFNFHSLSSDIFLGYF